MLWQNNPMANVKKVDCALLPPSLPSLKMHIKRANCAAILWANDHQPHPADGFFPEDYGWFLKDGKLHIDWYEGPCMSSSDFFPNRN